MSVFIILLLVINGQLAAKAAPMPDMETCQAVLAKNVDNVPRGALLSCVEIPQGESI